MPPLFGYCYSYLPNSPSEKFFKYFFLDLLGCYVLAAQGLGVIKVISWCVLAGNQV
jgi:hypothetical protein